MSDSGAAASPWVQALDMQGVLYRWWASSQGERFMEGTARYFESNFGQDESRTLQSGVTTEWLGSVPDNLRRTPAIESAKLHAAPCYWVHEDMVRLTYRAGETMDAETLEPTDLPSPSGFALLGVPIHELSLRQDEYDATPEELRPPSPDNPTVAFSWGPERDGIHLMFYTPADRLRPHDYDRGAVPPILIANQHVWSFGEVEPDSYRPVHLFCKAFWALCQQRVGEVKDSQPDRATRRRAARNGLDPSLVDIKVVQLRRREVRPSISDDPQAREWSCRWVVQGHWRNQWYPSLQLHRQKWIDDYIKGPEDAPLRLGDTVYKVDR